MVSNTAIVLKIDDRFFYKYKNKRVQTAWCLAGAKLFIEDSLDLKGIEEILKLRGKQWERKVVQVIE